MNKEHNSYINLYEKIKNEIVTQVYKYGQKLPSKRTTAINEHVSVITVQHAYALLCDEGYVEARERSGYFVNYRASDFVVGDSYKENTNYKYEVNDYTDDYLNEAEENYNFSFNILAKTARKVILDYNEQILERSPNMGCIELRTQIAAYLARSRGIHANVDQIVIGAGAEYLYSLVAQLFQGVGTIAVEKPCYDKIVKVYRSWGHGIDELKMGSDGILSEELARTRAGVLHVTPFHSYPSKITADISKKQEYIKWASSGRYIIEDNYDSELTVSRKIEDPLFSLAGGKNVLYINTFSKTIAPSIRIGYMILPQNMISMYHEQLGFYSCTAPVLEQLIISELLKKGDFERHVNKVRRRLREK